MATKTMHLSVSITGMLREVNTREGEEREEYCRGYNTSGYADFCAQLYSLQSKGIEYITADDCDHKDKQGACLGHIKKDKPEGTLEADCEC